MSFADECRVDRSGPATTQLPSAPPIYNHGTDSSLPPPYSSNESADEATSIPSPPSAASTVSKKHC